MHKKYHKKFKILDILAVTTQAREGIETEYLRHPVPVPGKKRYIHDAHRCVVTYSRNEV